ncbi:MAG: hypothetical protein CL811_00970 [Colwelliaceae bacterium]|nr:hypothetical protein [Colwelliaceae bacterium]
MKVITRVIASCLVMTLIGCVQINSEADYSALKREQLASSSVTDIEKQYEQGSKFTVSPVYLYSAKLRTEELEKVYEVYERAIVKRLSDAGYHFSSDAQASDFVIGFALALEADFSDETINEQFGVSPGLTVLEDLEKGSFLIYIQDIESHQRIWRGAVQGFVHEELSPVQREHRASKIVDSVLSQYIASNR